MTKLFRFLDSDCDDQISANAICTSILPRGILKILQPFLDELLNLEGGIGCVDREEFVEAMIRLYQTLSITERDLLINFDKRPKEDPYAKDCTFKPKLNRTTCNKNHLKSFLKPLQSINTSTITTSFNESQPIAQRNWMESTFHTIPRFGNASPDPALPDNLQNFPKKSPKNYDIRQAHRPHEKSRNTLDSKSQTEAKERSQSRSNSRGPFGFKRTP